MKPRRVTSFSAISKRDMANSVIDMSMNPEIIRKLQNIAPDISVGYVSAFPPGDVNRLPVEILAINHRSVTRQLVTAAHQQELDVYTWTVNRTGTMIEIIERNADGIITDQPALAIRIRNEMRELTTAGRLLLRFYQLLNSEKSGITY